MPSPGWSRQLSSREECRLIDVEARGFLVRLRSMGLINDEVAEELIDRITSAAEDPVNLQEMKILTALTLMARNNNQWQREIDCLMTDDLDEEDEFFEEERAYEMPS